MRVVGFVLVAAILWEVFNNLFRPSSAGGLSEWTGRRIFNLLRHHPRLLTLAGPVTLVTVIGLWVAGLVLGFALIYEDSFPAGFRTSTGVQPPASGRLESVLYFSFSTLITLGAGDLVPSSATVRLISSVEALIGFGLLTASVSFIVLLYPALARMRALAQSVSHLVSAERHANVPLPETGEIVLAGLAGAVTRARIDLIHFPLVYYFAPRDPSDSVAAWTGVLRRIARDAVRSDRSPEVRLTASALDAYLNDLAAILAIQFLHRSREDGSEAIFAAFAADQGVRQRAPDGTDGRRPL